MSLPIRWRFSVLILGVILLLPLIAAAREAPGTHAAKPRRDLESLTELPQRFSAAWAMHDGHALAQIMAPEVDFVTVGATWLHGRRDFELYHSRLLQGRFRDATITPLDTRVEFVRPNLAFVRWSWRIAGDRNFDGSPRPPRVGLMTMLAQRHGGEWLVIASQNTNKIPGSPPEDAGIHKPISLPEQ